MGIMRIGLCVSTLTLAKWLLIFSILLGIGCEKIDDPSSGISAVNTIDNFQRDNLEKIDDEWLTVDIVVEPVGEPKQIFRNVALSTLNNNPLVLSDIAVVTGRVQGIETPLIREEKSFAEFSSGVPVLEDSFSDFLVIPYENNSLYEKDVAFSIKGNLRPDGSFLMRLIAQGRYWFIFNPDGALDKAPLVFLSPPIEKDEELTLTPPKPLPFAGKIVASDGTILALFLENARIRAFRGERQFSSVGHASKDGSFLIELSTTNQEEKEPLYLLLDNPDKDITWPTFRFPVDKKALMNPADFQVDLGALSPFQPALIEVSNAKNGEAKDAEVILKGNVGNGTATISARLNDKGQARIEKLWQGIYEVAIMPPNESLLGLLSTPHVDFQTPEKMTLRVSLENRPRVNIAINDYQGENKNGFQVEITRLKEHQHFDASIINNFTPTGTFAVNDEGIICGPNSLQNGLPEFCPPLHLDNGKYRAHIIPSAGSMLSEKWVTFVVGAENTLTIELEKPALFSGLIKRTNDQSLGKMAYVTAFWSKSSSEQTPHTIGNAFAHEDGLFEILLVPPRGMFSE